MSEQYKYIYGPVPSWRLGSSLGIDPVSGVEKVCTFDCVYCQIGTTGILSEQRKVFVPTREIIRELNSLPDNLDIDYITFSGRCEPTLAENLGEIIREIKKEREENIAVLTNSCLLHREDVRQELIPADFVAVKLDAVSQDVLEAVNRPMKTIEMKRIIDGIKRFRKDYRGKLALQIMFIEENKNSAVDIARAAMEISPDEVQINTPLRPCGAKPLSREEIDKISGYFKGLKVFSVYKAGKKEVKPISNEDTLKRRGKI